MRSLSRCLTLHSICNVILSIILLLQLSSWCPVVCTASAKSIFGIRTKDSAYISTLSSVDYNGVNLLDGFQWIREVGGCLIGIQGDISDCEECFMLIETQNCDHELTFNSRPLSCSAIAYTCRHLIAKRLRTNKRLTINVIIAGWDRVNDRPQMYCIDEIASIREVGTYAIHGGEVPFLLSILDQHSFTTHSSNSSAVSYDDRAMVLLIRRCWEQLSRRSYQRIDTSTVQLMRVSRKGCKTIRV